LAACALARWVDVDWQLVGAALTAAAMAVIGRRAHQKVRIGAVCLAVVVGVIVAVLALTELHFERSPHLLAPRTSWVFATAVAGAAVAFRCAAGVRGSVVMLARVAAAALLVVLPFLWLNLLVANQWAVHRTIRLVLERVPARDLTISITWAVYGGALLAIGIWRRTPALRWASFAFLILTIGKVFLYDLGKLEGLFRAGSLFGLAICLLLVSVVYRRFVFRAV
jgi:uncharacterized membrane protein